MNRSSAPALLLFCTVLAVAAGLRAQESAPGTAAEPTATPAGAPTAAPSAPSPAADGGPAPVDADAGITAAPAGADGGSPTPAAQPAAQPPPPRKAALPPGPPPGRTSTAPAYPLPGTWGGDVTPVTDADADEYQRVVDEFAETAADVRREISDLVQAQYRERRARLKDEYETRIQAMEREEARRRLAAIVRFERFLERYPNDPTYTPDAVFRLAELYFEQATEEYQAALRKYDEDIQAFEAGELKVEPVSPEHHYERTIQLYQRLITEFPGHKNLDGAHYLLGYCLDEQGESDQAIVQFLELTRKFPQSRFYSESWMRVGEHYFDNDKLPEAIAAYSHVLETPESPYFDKALYKLGWSHYRMNEYDLAISRFLQVLDYSEQKKTETGTEGSDLVPESLQYIAVSLSDDNWDRGIAYDPMEDETGEKMVDFAKGYFKRLQGRAYERDVFVRLAEILFDASKYPGAVAAYNWVLELAPLHPDAPQQADKVVQSWERQREFDKSSAARELLVKNYSDGTPWYNANKDNIEAVRTAQALARTSLYTAAVFHHQQAQKHQSNNFYDLATKEFEQAANGYREYLVRFPRDKNSYELRWYLADTLYNSLQFREAATEYTKVRESNEGTKHRSEAALNVYFSLLKVVEQEEQAGRLEKKRPMTAADGVPPREEIAPLRVELIDACDRFVERNPEDARIPNVKATAAEILYMHGHFEEARPRLEEVLEKYPDNDAAAVAANYITQYLLAKKDWEQVEKFAQYVQQRRSGDAKTQSEYRTLELGALFQKAKMYMDEGENLVVQGKVTRGNRRLEQAASEYTRLVDQNKDHEFADKALFNAALAYKKAGRFDSALKLYERVFREYDKSDLAPTALSEVADNAYKSYDFNKAIESYQLLVKRYPDHPGRADAQYNVALTLENLQKYDDAAREYENYARMFPKREDAPTVFYSAALVQEKRGDTRAYVATLNRFLDKYKRDATQTDKVVEAYARLADVSLAAGKQADAEKYFRMTTDEFDRRKAAPQSVAGYHAARASFQLAEFALKKYERMKIEGKSKDQVKALQKKSEELKKMEKLYQEVLAYKQLDWALATAYRLGYLYENLAETVLASPCPQDVKRVGEEACDEYRILLEDRFAAPLEAKAATAYQAAVERAADAKVINTWTRRAREGLKKYQKDLQVDKEPRRRMVGPQFPGVDVVLPTDEAVEQKSLKGK